MSNQIHTAEEAMRHYTIAGIWEITRRMTLADRITWLDQLHNDLDILRGNARDAMPPTSKLYTFPEALR